MKTIAAVVCLLAASLTDCVSTTLARTPTRTRPVSACYISCPSGYAFRKQHKCRGDRRWFLDVPLIGQHTTRGADGGILTDVWTGCTGAWKPNGECSEESDFAKEDVVLMRCDDYIRQYIKSGEIEYGHDPGEQDRREKP